MRARLYAQPHGASLSAPVAAHSTRLPPPVLRSNEIALGFASRRAIARSVTLCQHESSHGGRDTWFSAFLMIECIG